VVGAGELVLGTLFLFPLDSGRGFLLFVIIIVVVFVSALLVSSVKSLVFVTAFLSASSFFLFTESERGSLERNLEEFSSCAAVLPILALLFFPLEMSLALTASMNLSLYFSLVNSAGRRRLILCMEDNPEAEESSVWTPASVAMTSARKVARKMHFIVIFVIGNCFCFVRRKNVGDRRWTCNLKVYPSSDDVHSKTVLVPVLVMVG
jgi:hypothetical protein